MSTCARLEAPAGKYDGIATKIDSTWTGANKASICSKCGRSHDGYRGDVCEKCYILCERCGLPDALLKYHRGNNPAVCSQCRGRDQRRAAWANYAGVELVSEVKRLGVGELFIRNSNAPSLDDDGLRERIERRPLPKGGLLLTGPVGTHKTHLLAARVVDAARRGYNAELIGWTRFLQTIRETYSNRNGKSELSIIEQYARLDYLALDDFGIGRTSESDSNVRLAFDLLDARYSAGARLVTDISTNLLPEEIGERFDERVARRVSEMTSVYPMLRGEK